MLDLIRTITDPTCTLRATDRMVVLALARHADAAGRCWPSEARLAACSGLSERQVRVSLRRLEAAGWLSTSRREGRANVYVLSIPTSASPNAEVQTPTPAEATAPPRQILPETPANATAVPRQSLPDTPAESAATPAESAARTNPITVYTGTTARAAEAPSRTLSGEEAAWCEVLLQEYREATGQQVARWRLLQVARERMVETMRALSGGGPATRQAFERARDEIRELRRYPSLLANPDLSPLTYRRLLVQARGTPAGASAPPASYLDRHPEFRPGVVVRMSDPMPGQGCQRCAG